LILRWNGSGWRRVAGQGIPGGLFGVTAVSARDAWAVGATVSSFDSNCSGSAARAGIPGAAARLPGADGGHAATTARPVILHWNGTAWKLVTSHSLRDRVVLTAVTATSANDAWAVGGLDFLQPNAKAQVLRWNGKSWK